MRALYGTTACRRTIRSDGGVAHSTGRLSTAATCPHRADASSLTTATDYDGPADGVVAVSDRGARRGRASVRCGPRHTARHLATSRTRCARGVGPTRPPQCSSRVGAQCPVPSGEDRPSGDPSSATRARRLGRARIGHRDGHCAARARVAAVRPSCTRGARGPGSSPPAPRDRSARRHPARRHTRVAVMGPMPGTVVNRATTGSCAAMRRKPVIRRGELLVQHRDHALQRRERLGDRRREVQRRHPDEEAPGTAAPNPEPGSARDRPRQRDRPGPTVRQFATDIELRLHRALRGRSPMRRAITSPLTRVRQRGDIAPIGFDASAALAIHGRERRIGHDHLVAEGLEVLRDPLALGRRLQQNAHRAAVPRTRP